MNKRVDKLTSWRVDNVSSLQVNQLTSVLVRELLNWGTYELRSCELTRIIVHSVQAVWFKVTWKQETSTGFIS